MIVVLTALSLNGLMALAENQGAIRMGPRVFDGITWTMVVELPERG